MKNENNSPLITIGIPFFNTEKHMIYAINSVLLQSYTNWELILMDDGSSDNSLSIAKKIELTDQRITVYSDGANRGLPTRLNQLSKLAKGQFYARMDADDMMHPDRIKTQVNFLKANLDVDLVGTNLVAIDEKNKIIGIRKGGVQSKYTLKDFLKKGGWSAHPTIMGRTSWFKENKYDEKLTRTEDFDLWMRTIEKSNFSKIDFMGLYYREESGLSLKKYITSTKQSLKLYKKNKKIIGIYNWMFFSVKKVCKLFIYLFFNYSGLMNIIVKRRSKNMPLENNNYHDKIIKHILQIK